MLLSLGILLFKFMLAQLQYLGNYAQSTRYIHAAVTARAATADRTLNEALVAVDVVLKFGGAGDCQSFS